MASPRPLTWRVQNIPQGTSAEALRQSFHSDDRQFIEIKSLVSDVDNYDGTGTLTATMLFNASEQRKPRVVYGGIGDELEIDKDFIGFTPLNETSSDASADIIAITGLAGHAFGSWAHTPRKMWLRDNLPKDIKNRARVLIYGYESQLQGDVVARSILSDYSVNFYRSLMDIRTHPTVKNRPLILIGHSLGALIIKQAIIDQDSERLPIDTLLFFGAPHHGLETEALETLVKGQPTATLISELIQDSPTLDRLARDFRKYIDTLTIHSYYESRLTRTVVKNADGIWERCGPLKLMVKKSSALLYYQQERTQMPVDGDHSQIAKLKSGQGGVYPNVLRVIKDSLQSPSEQYAVIDQKEADTHDVTQSRSDELSPTRASDGESIKDQSSTRLGDDETVKDQSEYSISLAEQAEKDKEYEKMAIIMKHIACENKRLSFEEQKLFSIAYKNIVEPLLDSWRIIAGKEATEESRGNHSKVARLREDCEQIEAKITKNSKEVLEILDKHLIPNANIGRPQVFLYKLKGDYNKYLAEIASEEKRRGLSSQALTAYVMAEEVAQNYISPSDPIRLRLILSYSVLYFDILNSPDMACAIARKAIGEAVVELDGIAEEDHEEIISIIQLLEKNSVSMVPRQLTSTKFTN